MGDSAADGISFLLRALRDDNLSPGADLTAATERLRGGGEEAADGVASLIQDLVDSRSPGTSTAVAAARACVLTPALTAALRAVADAPELRQGHPGATRFTPEIFGDGKIGWTSGTAARTRDLARQVLGVVLPEPPPTADGNVPEVSELVTRVREFVAGREHATTVTESGQRAGARAAVALRQLIEQDRSGPMALAVVYAVRNWAPADALPFIRHALGTGYPGAEYYGRGYIEANPTPEALQVGRDCLPQMKDAEERNALRAFLGT